MQNSVNGFVPSRLKQALSYRMLNKSSFAELVGIHNATVSKYLSGEPVGENTFDKICSVLSFPRGFFLREISTDEEKTYFWRSLATAKKQARERGESALELQIEVWDRFAEIFDFPSFSLDHLQVKSRGYKNITYEEIDKIALQVRDEWGLAQRPIPHLIRSMEKAGILVNTFNLGVEKLDAVSVIRKKIPHVLLNVYAQSLARMRFDAAHELGHILLHSQAGELAERKGDDFEIIEDQAHYFASSLLLPEEAFLRDMWAPTLKCLKGLKSKWVVSIQAMMRRALNLKAITQSQYQHLNIAISRKGWRKKEPLDDSLPLEKPRLFSQAMERLMKDRDYTKEHILQMLHLPSDVVERFFVLEPGFFDSIEEDQDNNVVLLADFRKEN